jgi:hypothetical protein
MKRFFTNIIILLLLLSLSAYLFDIIISNGLKKTEKGHFFAFNKIMNDTINADILISGNSRAGFSYDTDVIDSILNMNSFNVGVSGQPFGISYLRQIIYNRHNKPPKLLIQNIDYVELNLFANGFEREQYFPYMLDKDVFPILKDNDFSWADIYIPLYRYRGNHKLMGIGLFEFFGIKHTKTPYCKGGFYRNPNTVWNPSVFYEKIKNDEKIKCATNPLAITKMEDLIEKRQKDGTKIVLVYAPLYRGLKDFLENGDEVMQIYNNMATKYNIPILDYTDSSMCVDSTYFVDTNHLTGTGARIFTTQLAHDIDSLGLLKP